MQVSLIIMTSIVMFYCEVAIARVPVRRYSRWSECDLCKLACIIMMIMTSTVVFHCKVAIAGVPVLWCVG